MRELEKVVNVVRKRSKLPVYTVLVIDATTGQNGLQQAREFNRALDLDALIVTKLDGTAKGGIALAVSHELGLPIVKIGVGEGIDDLRDFDAREFASALVGTFDERFDADEDGLRGENAKEARPSRPASAAGTCWRARRRARPRPRRRSRGCRGDRSRTRPWRPSRRLRMAKRPWWTRRAMRKRPSPMPRRRRQPSPTMPICWKPLWAGAPTQHPRPGNRGGYLRRS